MGREATSRPSYQLLAIVTRDKTRVIGGAQLTLFANNENEQKVMVQDVAKAMKADVVKMKNGDYLILRV
ncbi:capping complex subunit for YIEGIA [Hathewaya limosa]|uniref:Uncharacterized protein n=1 Tax=Hathewaya limosa TaxID=1536 RepID=A0ABU0JNJ8_HATLI|nr:hypothetical protein [Hathewaya limosa]MDQ0478654.1 hypothetical protein [Hathewaya limosa]